MAGPNYGKGSGTPANPIILGAYGEVNVLLLTAMVKWNAPVYLSNQSNWVIQDLELMNHAPERRYLSLWYTGGE